MSWWASVMAAGSWASQHCLSRRCYRRHNTSVRHIRLVSHSPCLVQCAASSHSCQKFPSWPHGSTPFPILFNVSLFLSSYCSALTFVSCRGPAPVCMESESVRVISNSIRSHAPSLVRWRARVGENWREMRRRWRMAFGDRHVDVWCAATNWKVPPACCSMDVAWRCPLSVFYEWLVALRVRSRLGTLINSLGTTCGAFPSQKIFGVYVV